MGDGNNGNDGGIGLGTVLTVVVLAGAAALGVSQWDRLRAFLANPGGVGAGPAKKPDDAAPAGKDAAPDVGAPPASAPPPPAGGAAHPAAERDPPGMVRTWAPGTTVTLPIHKKDGAGKEQSGFQRYTIGADGRPSAAGKVGDWLAESPFLWAEADASHAAGKLAPKVAAAPVVGVAAAPPVGGGGGAPGTDRFAGLAGQAASAPGGAAGGGGAAAPMAALAGLAGGGRGPLLLGPGAAPPGGGAGGRASRGKGGGGGGAPTEAERAEQDRLDRETNAVPAAPGSDAAPAAPESGADETSAAGGGWEDSPETGS